MLNKSSNLNIIKKVPPQEADSIILESVRENEKYAVDNMKAAMNDSLAGVETFLKTTQVKIKKV